MKYFNKTDLENTYISAVRIIISVPSIIKTNQIFNANIALLKANGYPDFEFEGTLKVFSSKGIQGLPKSISFKKEDEGHIKITNLSINKEGFYHIKIQLSELNHFPSGRSNGIWCVNDFPYNLYFGDIHVHSTKGHCGTPFMPKSPDFGYWYAKYIAGHDFCSITDHASNASNQDWLDIIDSTKKWHEPNEFISILGYECDYDGEDGGHYNIYFPNDIGEMKNFKLEVGGTLEKIFKFTKANKALAISHHSARTQRGRDYKKSYFGGQEIEPCSEVISQWGSSECILSNRPIRITPHKDKAHYYNYAIQNGYKLGALGSSDSHSTTPGGFAPMIYPNRAGKTVFEYSGAITGIFSKSLTREDLFSAVKNRRCFATANDQILLWIYTTDGFMGEEITTEHDLLNIMVLSASNPILEVHVIKNGLPYQIYNKDNSATNFSESDFLFKKKIDNGILQNDTNYYIKVIQSDGDLAISSPLWLLK